MAEDVVPMAGTSTMVDDVVPISVEGSSEWSRIRCQWGWLCHFFFLIIGLRIKF